MIARDYIAKYGKELNGVTLVDSVAFSVMPKRAQNF